jgi:hypothetical protein
VSAPKQFGNTPAVRQRRDGIASAIAPLVPVDHIHPTEDVDAFDASDVNLYGDCGCADLVGEFEE